MSSHLQNLKAEIRISDRPVSHPSSKLLKMQIPGPHFRTAKSVLVGEGKLEMVIGMKWMKEKNGDGGRWRGVAEQESAFLKLINELYFFRPVVGSQQN